MPKKRKTDGNKKYKGAIKKKLNITFVTIIVLMCILNGVLIFNCFDYMKQYNSILDNITLSNTINGILQSDIDTQMREIVTGRCLFEDGKQYQIVEKVDSKLQIIMDGAQTEEIQLQVETIQRTMQTLRSQIDKIEKQIQQDKKYEEKLSTLEYIGEVTTIINEDIQTLIYYELKNGEQVKQRIHRRFMKTIIINSIILSCLAFFSLFRAWHISNSISKPINHLYQNVSSVAAGDLTIQNVKINTKDEIGLLAEVFNEMVKQLRQIIKSVDCVSEKVYTSSDQLYQSMESNSQATEEIACASQKIAQVIYTQNDELKKSVIQVENMSNIFEELLREAD
jgi:methyl-accepting chemotaxis protein